MTEIEYSRQFSDITFFNETVQNMLVKDHANHKTNYDSSL